ncbi:7-carboxy-7-deazaguanine synthase QueE [Pelosinus sp. sgz500959]|uniref:7-carboxy-7-deazaguanine synthase QueE n=1 Tax=Pelosinus sp. sgz500959 TaxID=3242472 RepID=UPI00366D5B23
MGKTVNVVEVFSSIQGEGQYVGYRQIFVRLVGCNLECEFCDTPDSRQGMASGQIEITPGKRDFKIISNPIPISQLAAYINQLLILPHHSVSLTGGEPLCQTQAIEELAPLIHGMIHLETNGTLPTELAKVLPYIDMISMDIKLPSTSGQELWQKHEEFLRLANTRRVFVKIVVTNKTSTEEFQQAIELIATVNPEIPLIIQPVTPINHCGGVSPDQVLVWQEQALTLLTDVRVIPQTHKFMGQL